MPAAKSTPPAPPGKLSRDQLPHADLVANGGDYRSLRRSLKKRDLWPDAVEPFVAADPERGQGLRDALVAELVPVLTGKRLLNLARARERVSVRAQTL